MSTYPLKSLDSGLASCLVALAPSLFKRSKVDGYGLAGEVTCSSVCSNLPLLDPTIDPSSQVSQRVLLDCGPNCLVVGITPN